MLVKEAVGILNRCPDCGSYLKSNGACIRCKRATLRTCAKCYRLTEQGYRLFTTQGLLCEKCIDKHEKPGKIDGDPPHVAFGVTANLLPDCRTVQRLPCPTDDNGGTCSHQCLKCGKFVTFVTLTRLRNDKRLLKPAIFKSWRWHTMEPAFNRFRYAWSITSPMGVWSATRQASAFKVSWRRAWHVLLQTSLYLAITDPRRRDSHGASLAIPFPDTEARAYATIRREVRYNLSEWLLDGETPDSAFWTGEVMQPAFRTRPAQDLYPPTSQPLAPYDSDELNRQYRRANHVRDNYKVRATTEPLNENEVNGGDNDDPIGDRFYVPRGSGYTGISEGSRTKTYYSDLGAAGLGSLQDALSAYQRPRGAPYGPPDGHASEEADATGRADMLVLIASANLSDYEQQILTLLLRPGVSTTRPWRDVGEIMGEKPATIRQAVHRIRTKLKKLGESVTLRAF